MALDGGQPPGTGDETSDPFRGSMNRAKEVLQVQIKAAIAPCQSLLATQRRWTRPAFRYAMSKLNELVALLETDLPLPPELNIPAARRFCVIALYSELRVMRILLEMTQRIVEEITSAGRLLYNDLQLFVRVTYHIVVRENPPGRAAREELELINGLIPVPLAIGTLARECGVPCPTMTRQCARILQTLMLSALELTPKTLKNRFAMSVYEVLMALLEVCNDVETVRIVVATLLDSYRVLAAQTIPGYAGLPKQTGVLAAIACTQARLAEGVERFDCPELLALLMINHDNLSRLTFDENNHEGPPTLFATVIGCVNPEEIEHDMDAKLGVLTAFVRMISSDEHNLTVISTVALLHLVTLIKASIVNKHACKHAILLDFVSRAFHRLIVATSKDVAVRGMIFPVSCMDHSIPLVTAAVAELVRLHAGYFGAPAFFDNTNRQFDVLVSTDNALRHATVDALIAITGAQKMVDAIFRHVEIDMNRTTGLTMNLILILSHIIISLVDVGSASCDRVWACHPLWRTVIEYLQSTGGSQSDTLNNVAMKFLLCASTYPGGRQHIFGMQLLRLVGAMKSEPSSNYFKMLLSINLSLHAPGDCLTQSHKVGPSLEGWRRWFGFDNEPYSSYLFIMRSYTTALLLAHEGRTEHNTGDFVALQRECVLCMEAMKNESLHEADLYMCLTFEVIVEKLLDQYDFFDHEAAFLLLIAANCETIRHTLAYPTTTRAVANNVLVLLREMKERNDPRLSMIKFPDLTWTCEYVSQLS